MDRKQRRDSFRLEAFTGVGGIITAASMIGLVIRRDLHPILGVIGLCIGLALIQFCTSRRATLEDE